MLPIRAQAKDVRIRAGFCVVHWQAVRPPAVLKCLSVPQVEASVTRRGAAATVAAGLALLCARPASAFLGFGEPSKEDVYKDETVRWSGVGQC